MADESILTYKKPGFPKTDNNDKSYQTTIEYIGPLATLASAEPATNSAWGEYDGVVRSSNLSPIEGTDQAELTVICEFDYATPTNAPGEEKEVTLEVEWVMFQRSLFEHPEFTNGGTYALDNQDYADIQAWINEQNPTLKAAYKYNELELTGSGTEAELSAAAKKFVDGLNILGEPGSYEDYAPVIRRTTTFLNGLPDESDAGLKGEEPTFSGKPDGYEWRKSADRAIRAGGQRRWERTEEWMGAIKVLIDRDTIFY
jgi:hypothetical protein